VSLASVKSRLVLVPVHLGSPRQCPEGREMDVCVITLKSYCLSYSESECKSYIFGQHLVSISILCCQC